MIILPQCEREIVTSLLSSMRCKEGKCYNIPTNSSKEVSLLVSSSSDLILSLEKGNRMHFRSLISQVLRSWSSPSL